MKQRTETLTAAILMFGAASTLAAIPEPDFILHGKVRLNGVQLQPADDVRVLAKVTVPRGNPPVPTEQIVGSYHLGDILPAGNNYILRIRLENLIADGSTTQSANAALAGQTATLYVRRGATGADAAVGTALLSAPGTIDARDLSLDVCGILTSSPANCSIDALQPSNPNGSNPAGITSIMLNYSCATTGLSPSDFAVTRTPPIGPQLSVGSVSTGNQTATLQLAGGARIPAGAWTCFQHTANGTRTCVGFQPGDANGDGTTSVLDIVTLVNARNAVVSLPTTQTDMDRSGQFNSTDITRLIQLFDGFDAFDAWYGSGIGECPSPP